MGIKDIYKVHQFQKKWKAEHNLTYPVVIFNPKRVKVGKYTYGPLDIVCYDKNTNLEIGAFCSIAKGSKFILGGEHNYHFVSTYPFMNRIIDHQNEAESKGNIVLGDDVWIGQNALVLSGVQIGQGAVVAAGAVVSNDVPPYAIVGGVPAKVIKYRFTPEVIDELMKIDYSKLEEKDIKEHINDLYRKIKTVEDAERLTAWMPRKSK